MSRLKFLLFALLALSLWVIHLFLLSPVIGAVGVDQATRQAISAPAAVALRLESNRSELQAAVLKLASTPAITNPGPRTAKPELPSADRYALVRTALFEALPEAFRPLAVVGVHTEGGTLMAQGTSDPAPTPEGFDAKAVSAAGGRGEVMDALGVPHLFYSVPLFAVDKNEVKAVGAVFVGLPLVIDAQKLVEGVAKELSLSAVGLSVNGKVVAAGGARKELVDAVLKLAKPGQSMRAEKGAAMDLGPIKLPMLTGGDVLGGEATTEMGVRRDVPGTPFEVIAVASVRPAMEALAGYQKTALFMLLGLLIAAAGFTLLIGGAAAEQTSYVGPRVPPAPVPLTAKSDNLAPLAIADAPAPAEASPDDFDFPASSPSSPGVSNGDSALSGSTLESPRHVPLQGPFEDPAEDPFASMGPGGQPAAHHAPPPVMTLGEDDYEGQRTTSYPAHGYANPMSMASTQNNPALDPFAMAGGIMSAEDQAQADNPDATRVAVIPQELLKASARGNSSENPMGSGPKVLPMPRVASVAPPSVAAGGGSEEVHFQEVFRDFLATRERCGEPADGLTFDKFVAKLRKNKDQLVTKYNCKTVRFQVYVKEGKAALKATPVKE